MPTSTVERPQALPVLKDVPLFAGLTPQQLRRVAEVGRARRFRAGRAIVHLGEPGDTFYVILDGHALVDRDDRRLERHDAAATLVNDRVRRAEIDRELPLRPKPTESGAAPQSHGAP